MIMLFLLTAAMGAIALTMLSWAHKAVNLFVRNSHG
jgi:hypothetical protein